MFLTHETELSPRVAVILPWRARSYRDHLQSVLGRAAVPYGYTLTIWTSGAVTIREQGELPTAVDAILFLLGASLAYLALGMLAYGRLGAAVRSRDVTPAPLWTCVHLPAASLSVLSCAALGQWLHGRVAWPVAGAVATAAYLVVLAGQLRLASLVARRWSAGADTTPVN